MLLLTTTTDLLQLITGAAASTDIVTSYVDITTTGVTPGSFEANVSTATTTTIVAAPAASTQRQVKMVSIRNNSTTTAQTVTVQKSSSSTAYNITGAITLQAGETFYYQDMYGFSVRDVNGQIKQTINSTNTALTSTYVGYGNGSGVLTGSSNFAYSTAGGIALTGPGTINSAGITVTNPGNAVVSSFFATNTNSGSGAGIYTQLGNGTNNLVLNINGTGNLISPVSGGPSGVASCAIYTQGTMPMSLGVNSTEYIRIGANGNVTHNAPTSGTALTVNGVGPVNGQIILISGNSSTTSGADLQINRAGSTSNTIEAGPNLVLNDSTNSTSTCLQNSGGQTELWQYNSGWKQILAFSAAGIMTLGGSPVSGATGTRGDLQLYRSGATTTGTIYFGNSSSNTPFIFFDGTGFDINPGSYIKPNADNSTTLGNAFQRWSVVYSNTGTINTSDARLKTDVKDSALGLEFITKLHPVSYKWINGGAEKAGVRTHYGLIAQEVKATLDEVLPGQDFAGWVLADKNDPMSTQSIRYDQLISPLIKAVQEQQVQIEAQQSQINILLAQVATLLNNRN